MRTGGPFADTRAGAEGGPAGSLHAGIGLRHPHYAELLQRRPDLGFIEVHSENFFADGGLRFFSGSLLARVLRPHHSSLLTSSIEEHRFILPAEMAELADALDSGSSPRKGVEVRVLFSASTTYRYQSHFPAFHCWLFIGGR